MQKQYLLHKFFNEKKISRTMMIDDWMCQIKPLNQITIQHYNCKFNIT